MKKDAAASELTIAEMELTIAAVAQRKRQSPQQGKDLDEVARKLRDKRQKVHSAKKLDDFIEPIGFQTGEI